MAEENKSKIVLEREYVVPLRSEWLKVPDYKRSTKAVKALKEFMVRHMKVYDRDLRKIKVDIYLNNELRFRGIKKPWHKIKVKATKYDNGDVVVTLVELPKHVEFEIARKARKEVERMNRTNAKPEVEKEEKKEETKDEKEKKESSKLATEQMEKAQAKEMQHTSKTSQETPKIQRKALKR